jgi:hypothetical protein
MKNGKEYHIYGDHELVLEYTYDDRHPHDPENTDYFSVDRAFFDAIQIAVRCDLEDTTDRDFWAEYLIEENLITEDDSVVDFIEPKFLKRRTYV